MQSYLIICFCNRLALDLASVKLHFFHLIAKRGGSFFELFDFILGTDKSQPDIFITFRLQFFQRFA